MKRRDFFKLVGASAAFAAVPLLSSCSSAAAPSAEGAGVLGQPQVSFSTSVDVLILGSGMAGLSAAMDPSEAGLSVMVAEKLDVLGGESYESNAVMEVCGSQLQKDAGITETCDDVWPERKEALKSAGVTDLDFAKRLFYAAPEWVDRMKSSYGAQFADPASYSANEANRRRVLPKNGIGDTESIMMPLRDKLAAKGVQFSTGYCATGFILDEAGKVCGVRFSTSKKDQSGVVDVHARAVVVATGGFASNQSLVRQYLSAWERVGCYTAASMGEGHKLCQALGAQLSDMSVTPSVISDLPQAAAWGMFAPTLVVDAQGNRFANEDYMRDLCAACFTQERGYFWTIFDSGISESGQARSAAQVTAKHASRLVGPCDTVEQLASGMGVSEDVLGKTVDRFSSMVEAGKDSDFGRKQFLENLKPPYYALKQFPVRFRTRGGAVVDGGGRLLDANGKAIAGVYCCGAAAQGGGESLTTNGAFGILTGRAVTEDLGAA